MDGKVAAVYALLFGLVFHTTFGFIETLETRAKRSLGTLESCHELSKKFENCTSKLSWNLRDLPSFTNCQRKDNFDASICVENALCKKSECMDLNAVEEKAVSCPKVRKMFDVPKEASCCLNSFITSYINLNI